MNINTLQVKELQKTGKEILVQLFVKFGFKPFETVEWKAPSGEKMKWNYFEAEIGNQNSRILEIDMELNLNDVDYIVRGLKRELSFLRKNYSEKARKYAESKTEQERVSTKRGLLLICCNAEFIKLLINCISNPKPSK